MELPKYFSSQLQRYLGPTLYLSPAERPRRLSPMGKSLCTLLAANLNLPGTAKFKWKEPYMQSEVLGWDQPPVYHLLAV